MFYSVCFVNHHGHVLRQLHLLRSESIVFLPPSSHRVFCVVSAAHERVVLPQLLKQPNVPLSYPLSSPPSLDPLDAYTLSYHPPPPGLSAYPTGMKTLSKGATRLRETFSPALENSPGDDGLGPAASLGAGDGANHGVEGGGNGCSTPGGGFEFEGLWSVARTVRTRGLAWMERRVFAGGSRGDGVSGDGNDFTLLALAGEYWTGSCARAALVMWSFPWQEARATRVVCLAVVHLGNVGKIWHA